MPATVLLVEDSAEMRRLILDLVLRPRQYQCLVAEDGPAGLALAHQASPDVLITDMHLPGLTGLELIRRLRAEQPALPAILITAEGSQELAAEAFRAGAADYLSKPFDPESMAAALERALAEGRRRQSLRVHDELEMTNEVLQGRLRELEALLAIGRSVTSMLNLDAVLTRVVEAAVHLTGAEEGSLLLLDEASGVLSMRAAKNFDDEFVRTFRLESRDSLAGQVIRTGQPVLLDNSAPQKIKTAYLVRSLIYVPLRVRERVIGVLGVDHRTSGRTLTRYDQRMLMGLADYAAVAIENAGLYARANEERSKLEAVLKYTRDGVIVVDRDERLILINRAARETFGVNGVEVTGRRLDEVLPNAHLRRLFAADEKAGGGEIPLDDGRTFNAQITPIEGVGRAMIMQDITRLKEMDRIKSEFVTAVSHDLRSPLTTILGYAELVQRAGPLNAQQAEFIRHIGASVESITALVTDLLDLGKIEAGFDSQKAPTQPAAWIHDAVEAARPRAEAKRQALIECLHADLPPVFGNAIRLRQMVGNLIDNAIKYTPAGGRVDVTAFAAADQLILTVADTGMGIALAEQAFIFDKFYRSPAAQDREPGSGLGLSIVRSIVDGHGGRIWVDSKPGQGSTFTVVLPAMKGQ